MSLRSQFTLATLSVLATAALAVTAAEARPGQGQGQQPQPSQPVVQEAVPEAELTLTGDAIEATAETADIVNQGSLPLHGSVTQASADHPQNLPPGLQRRVENGRGLPPGLQRRIDSGRGLPAGLNR
ncbi:hypothetical protein C7293_04265 [filamentous cyanobacterium CCT1]|nr:hypothetical protein C7293_04265 [filamentous cyanobacterium CCT1]PSN81130.1 hypothetical protein C8B47_02955 [filamentous cyanobacterium CCP4]